jgi:hypothetical protein
MRQAAGQAAEHAGRLLHVALRVALVLAVLLAVVLGGLAWRLSRGPLELPWLIPSLEQSVPAPYRLSVQHLALAWEGLGERVDRPLDLRLRGVTLADRSGARILQSPSIEVSLSVSALLRGAVEPRAIDIEGLRLRGWRLADGSAALDLSGQNAAPTTAEPNSAGLLEAMLTELAGPPDGSSPTGQNPSAAMLRQLRRVRLRHAEIAIVDRQLDTVWHIDGAELDLRRRRQGGMDATAGLTLHLGSKSLPFSATATLPPGGTSISFGASLPPLVPAELAAAVPGLKPLAALDAGLSLTLQGDIDTGLRTPRIRLNAELGPGIVHLGHGVLPLRAAKLQAEGSLAEFDLRILALDVAPPATPGSSPGPEGSGGPTTHITGWLHGRRADGRIDAALSLALDVVDFSNLAALWPVGLGGPGTRPWLTANIPSGQLTGLHLALALHAAEDFSNAQISYIDGGAAGHNLTVHWLRPVPPIVQGEALLRVTRPDVLRIQVLSGVQSLAVLSAEPGRAKPAPSRAPLQLTGGEVVLSGLTGDDQFADITGQFTGPVASLLTVLGHPRLHLLDRRPIPLHDPAGEATGQFTVAQLPLKHDLDIGDIHVQAGGHLTGVHLGGIVAGHDLDRGVLNLLANNDGLSVQGNADLAGIPSALKVEMDFRGGPPSQTIQTISVQATPSVAQLAQLGLGLGDVLTGAVGIDAQMTSRRNGADTLAVKADLTPAGLDLHQLNWSKPPARAATAEARVQMRDGRVTALDGVRASGPGIDVRGSLAFADGRPRQLELQRLALGEPGQPPATDLAGSLAWPARPGAPWVASLHGPSLDAGDQFDRPPSAPSAPKPGPGPAWQVQAQIGRVLAGKGQALSGVRLEARDNGTIITQAALSGATLPTAGGKGGPFQLSIVPDRGGRRLSGTAADAGGLLRALGVVPDLYGGHLTLGGQYDDGPIGKAGPDHPLVGSVQITDFRLKDAPVAARLLQALSGYGIFKALGSDDLGFTEFVARFRYSDDVVTLSQARAFNPSLGITAKGRLDLARQAADVEGTIVPAYLLNSFLGHLPLIGQLLSPERGGGLIAMNYSVRGPFADPRVVVNPLSAVTPGFLRGLFDVFDAKGPPDPGAPAAKPLPPTPPGGIPSDG